VAVALAYGIGRVCLTSSAFGFSCITHPLLGPVLKALVATSWWGAFLAFALGVPPAVVAYVFAVAESELVSAVVPGSVLAQGLHLALAQIPDAPASLSSIVSSFSAGALLVALYLQLTKTVESFDTTDAPTTPTKAERPVSPAVRKSARKKTELVEEDETPVKKAPAKTPAKTPARTAKTPAKTPSTKVAAYADDYEDTPRRSSRLRTSRA
jgi:hypothetical protein